MSLIPCSRCSAEISDKAKICPKCGAAPGVQISPEAQESVPSTGPRKCDDCGRDLPKEATICLECGATVEFKPFAGRIVTSHPEAILYPDDIPKALYAMTAVVGFPFGTGYAIGSYLSQTRLINSGRYNEARRKIKVARIVCWVISIPCCVILFILLKLIIS